MFSISLQAKKEVAKDTFLYTFSRPEAFSFLAGQYVSMKIVQKYFSDEKGDFRSFSIASPPYRKDILEFSMRRSESAFKKNLEKLEIGGLVEITPATGKCVLPNPNEKGKIAFLIGGVGITPVRSILLEAVHEGRPENFFVLYSNRTMEYAPFFEEIGSWNEDKKIDLTVVHTMTELEQSDTIWRGERGFLDAEKVNKYVGTDWNECDFYMVGVAPFVEFVKKMLLENRANPERIYSDNFGGSVKR